MNRKFKLALTALLGFSAACSTVKNTPKEQPSDKDSTVVEDRPHIRVMYGVPAPENRRNIPYAQPKESVKEELDPVYERPQDTPETELEQKKTAPAESAE